MIKAEFLKENGCIDKSAKYLTMDNHGVDAFPDKPEYDESWLSRKGNICRLGNIEIEEFQGKDYKDCIYEFKPNEEDWVGKLCWVWDEENENKRLGVLKEIRNYVPYSYMAMDCSVYAHCKPAKKSEIEFVEED